ncbi:hypothetical protein PC110_g17958 [Phytophthora cactorum]|uniref:Helicase-associated domain-containing protein n=2 Tax=Phytophthora cactorum TaxID=29920 RepID=A0A329RLI8_9STRA|nr:hypothetical protein PC110_g17958 [Phytophthora cactorum]
MIEELEKIGFVQDASQFKWDHYILSSLRQFEKLYGSTDVLRPFVVPEGDEAWPKFAWGRRLGFIVAAMRSGKVYAPQSKEELEKLGFCFTSIAERDWTEKMLPSLKTYRQEFGHCIVRSNFKVPSCHPWPTKAWGMSLGIVVFNIRVAAAYVEQVARDKDILATIDFASRQFGTNRLFQVFEDSLRFSRTAKSRTTLLFQVKNIGQGVRGERNYCTVVVKTFLTLLSFRRKLPGPSKCGEFVLDSSWLATCLESLSSVERANRATATVKPRWRERG